MLKNYQGKKLLVLGGAYLHNKVVEAANQMGVYTIVTDNVPDSPAKKIASKSYDLNVSDVDGIVEMCKREGVEGVITVCLEFCQQYYLQICKKLGLPCFGTQQQLELFSNKEAFKELCKKNGVDIIPTYEADDLNDASIYPVVIKPSQSNGSRGQSICYSVEDAQKALSVASEYSKDGKAIIEKYMGSKDDFQVTYLVIDGEVFVVRTADRYLGSKEEGMDRVAIALSSPSKNTDLYFKNVHPKMIRLLKDAGITNSPVFIQGFVDGDTIRFYDPGLRFPGGDYDRVFASVVDADLMKLFVQFAFEGKFLKPDKLTQDALYLNDNTIFTLHSLVRDGIIKSATPHEELCKIKGVQHVSLRHQAGDKIEMTGTVNQRIAEFNILGATPEDVRQTVEEIERKLVVLDENNKDMCFCKFDVNSWQPYVRSN